MTYVTHSHEECQKMNFEDFQNTVLQIVREKNYMNLIDGWDKKIIHKDFSDKSSSTYGDLYFGTIYFADTTFAETLDYEFKITLYTFSYFEREYSASLDYTECSLYKKEIDSICKLSSCFNVNKNGFLDCALDEYHSASTHRTIEVVRGCPEQPRK